MSFILGTGFDTFNEQPGLEPIVAPGAPLFAEDPDSPIIEFGEQCTITHKGTGDYQTCLAMRMPRGTYLTDSSGNITRVLTCRIQRQKANRGTIEVVSESISFAVPPDEFAYDPVEVNPALEKNQRYTANPDDANHLTNGDIINIRAALESPQEAARVEALGNNPYEASDVRFVLFNELYSALRRGEENFYMSGIKIVWSYFAWKPQPMSLGSFIQDPTLVLPFQYYIGDNGPVIPGGMSFLRLADAQPFNRTWWKLTLTWIGFPQGHWNPNIYSTPH